MDARLRELVELGPLRVREALDDGVPREALRTRRLARPVHGVRSLGPVDVIDAIVARMDAGHFLSHAAAARVWGIRLPPRIRSRAIDVSALMPHHAPRIDGVIPHRLQEEHVELALLDGVRVTTPTETWRHLSTVLSLDELVAAGDSLIRRIDPLASEAELLRALARHAGARGVRRLRAAYALVRPKTDSRAETRLRLLLIRAGLPEPLVNLGVDLPGYGQAFADLAYPDARVAVEYDGWQHRVNAEQYERDIRRREGFDRLGWQTVHVIASHFDAPDDIVERVRRAMRPNDQ